MFGVKGVKRKLKSHFHKHTNSHLHGDEPNANEQALESVMLAVARQHNMEISKPKHVNQMS